MKHILLMLIAMVATACGNNADFDPFRPDTPTPADDDGSAQALALLEGRIDGDFGPRRDFDGFATEMRGSSDHEWGGSTITVVREEESRGAAMIILWTNGITIDDIQAGEYGFDYNPSRRESSLVSANVCSGNSASSIDYDRPADHLRLVVTDVDGGRRLDVTTETALTNERGELTGETERARASFVLESP